MQFSLNTQGSLTSVGLLFFDKDLEDSEIMLIFAENNRSVMEEGKDIRWIQRYANFHKACGRLLAVTEADRFMEDLSELDDYAPLLKKLDEELEQLSHQQDYQQL